MKIDQNINSIPFQGVPQNDIFDLNVKLSRKGTDEKIENQLITSHFLCTPGCGNTGSMNSFCC